MPRILPGPPFQFMPHPWSFGSVIRTLYSTQHSTPYLCTFALFSSLPSPLEAVPPAPPPNDWGYLSHIWGLDTERTPRNPRRPLPPFDSAEARGTFKKHHRLKMFKKFTLTDRLLFIAVFLVIIFSKLLYLYDFKLEAIFVGLWAPSILAFGIYLKAIENSKDE